MAKHTEDGIEMSRLDMIVGWFFVLFVALVIALGMFGCNTVAGLGKDISAAAEGIRSEMAKESNE